MRNIILFFSITLFSTFITFSQSEEKRLLKVTSICEFEDSYLIECVESKLEDTIYIISEKENLKNSCDYEKIIVGKTYSFELQKRGVATANNLVIRIKDKIFWKTGDDIKKMPYFAQNIKDLWIEN